MFKYKSSKCFCGQEKDGICTKTIKIINGALEQDSKSLLQCGEIKRQLKELKSMNINIEATTIVHSFNPELE